MPPSAGGGHAASLAFTRVAHPAWSRLGAGRLKAGHAPDLEGSKHLLFNKKTKKQQQQQKNKKRQDTVEEHSSERLWLIAGFRAHYRRRDSEGESSCCAPAGSDQLLSRGCAGLHTGKEERQGDVPAVRYETSWTGQ